jgi:multiple antibiotic resistance protein
MPQTIVVYGSILLALLIAWVTLRAAEWLVLRMGQTGIRVMTRLMGLLLAAIAVQFVITGVREALAA